jgi:hypothetical protein
MIPRPLFRSVTALVVLVGAVALVSGCGTRQVAHNADGDQTSEPGPAPKPNPPGPPRAEPKDKPKGESVSSAAALKADPKPEARDVPKGDPEPVSSAAVPKADPPPKPEVKGAPEPVAAGPWNALIDPENSLAYSFRRGDQAAFKIDFTTWGPKWAWVGVRAGQRAQNGRVAARTQVVVNKAMGEVINLRCEVWQPGTKQLALQYDLESDRDIPITLLTAPIRFDPSVGRGPLTLTHAENKQTKLELPVRGKRSDPATSQVALDLGKGNSVRLALDPPCPIAFDGAMRIVLASDVYRKGTRRVTLTFTFPDDLTFLGSQADLIRLSRSLAGPDWFPFTPAKGPVEGVIDMDKWLEKPAGKRGGVRTVKDGFAFEDGTPVKFWGTNLSYTECAPEHRSAEFTAECFAKYGINAVRLHKFSYPTGQQGIGDPNDSTRMDAKGLERLDYFAAQLKNHGIYFGWSHTYGYRVVPGDRSRLLAYDEIANNLKGNTYALINYAEDVQDLMIEMVVNLLKHRNPYTDLTYAQEPALCFIELQNEDDIFFFTTERAFNACPTYKKKLQERYAAWLKERYGTQEKLRAAWGDALKANEGLADGSIVPQVNPWFFGSDNLPKQKDGAQRRLLDTAAFLHDVQNRFYTKFVKAIRDAGYRGPLNGSPWQAPTMLPHYYNLYSDYRVGFIDRHNYFEGSGPHMFESMLTRPGSGYFGSGLQQVIDRPFALSEWIHVYPNVYAAEGPAILAAYGMGLQGWDASYQFQSRAGRQFEDIAGKFPWGIWEADVPTSRGQYPTLARMIYRGDVKQGDVISVRRVSPAEMAQGKFSFIDKVEQHGDVKVFGGSVPGEALAAGRAVVEFTDAPQASQLPDMARYRQGSVIKSVTGQLAWDTSGRGFFTVDTAGTKGVVGFAEGKEHTLGGVKVRIDSPFASLFLTALAPKEDLASGKRALLSVLARQCNTGFSYFTPDGRVMDNGRAPILLEPVKATITISDRTIEAVNVLDHVGRRTGQTLPVKDGRFTIDGARDKAIYYEVVFK